MVYDTCDHIVFSTDLGAASPGKWARNYTPVGRKPQLMIDPNVDLANMNAAQEKSGSWIMPLEEPLRQPAWNVPQSQWKEHMKIPEIRFMKKNQ
jgi:hypothetical protein